MKLIKFYSEPQYQGLGQPQPTKLFIPEWYRKSESTFARGDNGEDAPGLKKCMPYMDSLVSGYVLTTPVNVYVNEKTKTPSLLFLMIKKMICKLGGMDRILLMSLSEKGHQSLVLKYLGLKATIQIIWHLEGSGVSRFQEATVF